MHRGLESSLICSMRSIQTERLSYVASDKVLPISLIQKSIKHKPLSKYQFLKCFI